MPSHFKYRFLFGLLLVFFSHTLFGQPVDQSNDQQKQGEIYFKHLTRENGLPSNVVRYVIKDALGYVWIATDNGLVRYDGMDMKIYRYVPGDSTSLAESSISVITQSSDSMIWIGTKNGLSVLDPLTEKITNYQYRSKGDKHFPGEWVLSFYEDVDGVMWIGTNSGIIKADPGNRDFQLVKLHRNDIHNHKENLFRWINNMVQDPRDPSKLFLATRGGLLLFDKNQMAVVNDYEKDVAHLYRCSALFIDGDSILWTAEWDTGLKKFNLKTETWEIYNPNGEANLNILDIKPKGKDDLWLATIGNGLGIYNKRDRSFQFIKNDPSKPKSPISNWIHGNLFEMDKSMWLLTNNGISITDPNYRSFHRINPKLPLSYISGFYNDTVDRRFFVSGLNCDGLSYWDENRESWRLIYPVKDLLKGDLSTYTVLRDSRGTIWVNSNKGLLYIDQTTNLLTRFFDSDGEPIVGKDTVFFALMEDSKQNLWIGTRFDGVIMLDSARSEVTFFKHNLRDKNSLIASREFKVIREDQYGKIWFGSYNGIAVFDHEKKQFFNPIDDYLSKNGMNNKVVWGIETDTLGRIYLSIDDEGLLRVIEDEKGKFDFKLFHLDHGLNDLNLFEMDRDPDGNIWIINEGICCFNPYLETFKVFDTRNGLFTNKNWNNTIYIDNEGNLFLDDGRRYETININDVGDGSEISDLLLESLEVNGEPKQLTDQSRISEKLLLKPHENDIVFSFKAICFGDIDQVKYKYWLEGYDEGWTIATNETTARYTNLSAGDYVFYVNASYRGIPENQTLEVFITIKPHFWQTWWFISLVILIVMLTVYGIFRWRAAQIRKKEQQKSGIQKKLAELEMEALRAQMNPHFIFNSLNSINNFILKNESEQASDFLVKFSRLVRQVLNNSKNKYVTLSDEIKALSLYIELEQLRFEYRFDQEINCDEDLDRDLVMVPPLIIQPYVENAIWHGLMHKEGRGNLVISIHRELKLLRFEIYDDGIGREKSKEYKSKFGSEKKSMGLSITKDRISVLNRLYNLAADMKIDDLYDDEHNAVGTKVIVKIPYITKQELSHESNNN